MADPVQAAEEDVFASLVGRKKWRLHHIAYLAAGIGFLAWAADGTDLRPKELVSGIPKIADYSSSGGLSTGAHERSLPYHAGMAAAFGLPKIEAIRSVTTYAAEILGVGDRIGTIEPGKDATLIVTDGDPLEIIAVS